MPDPKHYTVGWISAISTENVAAMAFLDEEHEWPDDVSPNDDNVYTLGKIGKHNVVIAALPDGEYGTDSAACVARDMLHSFPNIRIGLMVGIGGGAPSVKHDIRLGDIVVSAPRYGKGSVFQHDFGKKLQDQLLEPTRFLEQPPRALRAAMNGLKSRHEFKGGHQLEDAINKVLKKNPHLSKKYGRPDPSSDRLYKATVIHYGDKEASCVKVCGSDLSSLEDRPPRTSKAGSIVIHYGLIASGSELMKDARMRDEIAKEADVLCFEMEAAGLMNHFPCLVIRGICDYSDTHKNKEWQGYAAMAAAAYAKALLSLIPPGGVEAERKIRDILSNVENEMKTLILDERSEKINRWLSPPDPSTNFINALKQRQKDSGLWFLKGDTFTKWKTRRNSFLWLHGIPGCGKTILSSTIVDELQTRLPSQTLYFYFDFNDKGKQTLDGMVRSLISQLYHQSDVTFKLLESLFSSCEAGRHQPSCESLYKVLSQMIEEVEEVWIVLDALDECRTRRGPPTEGLLSWLKDLLNSEQRNIHLLVTSRAEQDIKTAISELACNDDIISIQSELISDDIRAYVHTRVREDDGLKRWRSKPKIQDEIVTALTAKAGGMFRWAKCQLDTLEDCPDPLTLRNALATLPKTLDETYFRIWRNIPDECRHTATRILQFLAFSERSLRVDEAVDAIAVDPKMEPYFDPENRMVDPQEISHYCSSLVVVVSTQKHSNNKDEKHLELQLAHFSVKEYLTSERLGEDIAQNFQEIAAKASIAKVCLAYLLHLDRDIPTNKIREIFPLAEYSARYWMDHAAMAEGKDRKLQGFIKKLFCHHRNSYWNCYSLYRPDRPWDNEPAKRGEKPAPALYYASFGGLVNAVQYILSQGADVNAQGGEYGNALQAASFEGHERVVELLLKEGADANAQGGPYGNALQAASFAGHNKAVELLLKEGADVNAQGGDYGNGLQAASLGGHEKVIELLVGKGANVNARGGVYGNALYAASLHSHEKVVEMLLDRGAEIEAKDSDSSTALHGAARKGNVEVIKELLDRGAEVNAINSNSQSPLHKATLNDMYDVAVALLDNGASSDLADIIRRTPLHCAIYNGNTSAVQLLLLRNADVHLTDGYGKSGFQWIQLNHHLRERVGILLTSPPDFQLNNATHCLRRSVWTLSSRLLDKDGQPTWPGYHQLGHCLMYLQEYAEALTAYEQQILAPSKGSDVTHDVICDICESYPILGIRYVCKTCPDVDLCGSCRGKYDGSVSQKGCCGHDLMSVPGPTFTGHNSKNVNALGETRIAWLERIKDTFGAPLQEYEGVEN